MFIAIVSKPFQYEDSIELLRSSLDQLEKIAIHKLPGAINTNIQMKKVKSPPPVPPKPPTIHQKPTIPPKPKQIHPITNALKKSNDNTQTKRTRGNSVSFAEDTKLETTVIPDDKPNKLTAMIKTEQCAFELKEELDDDDDDDTVIDFGSSGIYIKCKIE